MLELDDITGAIVDASLKIHRELGPGLLESVYETLLVRALERRGLTVRRQVVIPLEYEGECFDEAFRADIIVEGRVPVEVKATERFAAVHARQLLTYLRLARIPVGLLINFGVATLKEGLRRVVNDLPSSAPPRLRVNRQVHAPFDSTAARFDANPAPFDPKPQRRSGRG